MITSLWDQVYCGRGSLRPKHAGQSTRTYFEKKSGVGVVDPWFYPLSRLYKFMTCLQVFPSFHLFFPFFLSIKSNFGRGWGQRCCQSSLKEKDQQSYWNITYLRIGYLPNYCKLISIINMKEKCNVIASAIYIFYTISV